MFGPSKRRKFKNNLKSRYNVEGDSNNFKEIIEKITIIRVKYKYKMIQKWPSFIDRFMYQKNLIESHHLFSDRGTRLHTYIQFAEHLMWKISELVVLDPAR